MAKQHPVAAQAESICAASIEAQGVDLVETVFVKEGGQWFLRFYIDKPGGISMDDCVRVTQAIDPLIDEHLSYQGNYHLEVSSPGLDRPLKTRRDIERHIGEWVTVSLYQAVQGKKKHDGVLESIDADETIEISLETGIRLKVTKAERAKLTQAVRF